VSNWCCWGKHPTLVVNFFTGFRKVNFEKWSRIIKMPMFPDLKRGNGPIKSRWSRWNILSLCTWAPIFGFACIWSFHNEQMMVGHGFDTLWSNDSGTNNFQQSSGEVSIELGNAARWYFKSSTTWKSSSCGDENLFRSAEYSSDWKASDARSI